MSETAVRPQPLLIQDMVRANRLLAAMPRDALERLLPHMQRVRLVAGDVLHAGDEVKHLYFPIDAIVTLLMQLDSRTTAMVAIVGREGVAGVSAMMGDAPPRGRGVVLRTGDALKISAATLKAEFDRHDVVMRVLLRFMQALVTHISQAAVCNRHHKVEPQLCSWLLTCMDRLLQGSELRVTHETIAGMLGVRRESITESASQLRYLGLIAYKHGRIRILDRPGLLTRACECYQVVKRETDRLLPDRSAT